MQQPFEWRAPVLARQEFAAGMNARQYRSARRNDCIGSGKARSHFGVRLKWRALAAWRTMQPIE